VYQNVYLGRYRTCWSVGVNFCAKSLSQDAVSRKRCVFNVCRALYGLNVINKYKLRLPQSGESEKGMFNKNNNFWRPRGAADEKVCKLYHKVLCLWDRERVREKLLCCFKVNKVLIDFKASRRVESVK